MLNGAVRHKLPQQCNLQKHHYFKSTQDERVRSISLKMNNGCSSKRHDTLMDTVTSPVTADRIIQFLHQRQQELMMFSFRQGKFTQRAVERLKKTVSIYLPYTNAAKSLCTFSIKALLRADCAFSKF